MLIIPATFKTQNYNINTNKRSKTIIYFSGKNLNKMSRFELNQAEKNKKRIQKALEDSERLKIELRTKKINEIIPRHISNFLDSIPILRKNPKTGQIAYNIRNNDCEFLYLLKDNGEIINSYGGSKTQVCFPVQNNYFNAWSVHNHPSPEGYNMPFSNGWMGDIHSMVLCKNPYAILSTKKSLYIMSQPKNYNKSIFDEAIKEIDTTLEKKRVALKPFCESGELSMETADKIIFKTLDELWQYFAKKTGWEYLHLNWPN